MRRRSAFTLIELLVVISVILILAALVFPAVTQSLLSAHKASCLNNVRQIYLAVMEYAASHHSLYPALDQSNHVVSDHIVWNVPNQVYCFPFLEQLHALGRSTLFCPLEPGSEWHLRQGGRPYAEQWGIGYALWCGRTWPRYEEHVGPHIPGAAPARAQPTDVVVTDIVRNWCGAWVRNGLYVNNHYRGDTYAPTGGHCAFADGHARWTPGDKLNWDRFYNNSNNHTTPLDPGWNFCVGFQR